MNEKLQIAPMEDTIGVSFDDPNLLRQAFTHRSYLNEHREAGLSHNERLEFLGDAVLELAVTDYLFREYPDKTEGELTAVRAALVNTTSLSEAGEALGFNEHLLLSKGEAKDTGRARQYILANTFEAVIGAIYLDQGYEAAADFVGRNLFNKTHAIVEERLWQDAKSRFQEASQEKESVTPEYKVEKETGPDHDKHFEVGVYLGREQVAVGTGQSKQEAEQAAAEAALRVRGW